jgi:hypothetical protein
VFIYLSHATKTLPGGDSAPHRITQTIQPQAY